MALINCKECGKEISNQAKTCPHCGKRRSSGIGKIIGMTFMAVFVFTLIMTWISRITNNDHQPQSAGPMAPIDITSEQLYKEYEANEVAADMKYKNKNLRVTGEIRDIRKGFGDAPYVNLATGVFTHQVMVAFPAGKYDNQLATYSTGTAIEVTGKCTGKTLGMVGIDLQ